MHLAAPTLFAALLVSSAAWAIPPAPPSCDTRVVGGSAPANAPAVGLVSTTRSTVDVSLEQRGGEGATRALGRFELGGERALTLVDGRTLVAAPLPTLVSGETYTLQLSETCPSAEGKSGRATDLHPAAEAPLPTRLGTLDEALVVQPDAAIGAYAGVMHVRVFANDTPVEDIVGFYPDRSFGISGSLTKACTQAGVLDVEVRLEAEVIGSGVALEVPAPTHTSFGCSDPDSPPTDDYERDDACSVGWAAGSASWPLALAGLLLARRRRREAADQPVNSGLPGER